MVNKLIIARIYALLARVKQRKDVSISWTASHTHADTPLAKGNAAADQLAACGFPILEHVLDLSCTSPAFLQTSLSSSVLDHFCVALAASWLSPSRPSLTPV